MADLSERQYELGGVVFGDLTPIQSDDITIGDPGMRLGDQPTPGADGEQAGIDYHDGRTITLDLWTDTTTAADSRSAWSALAAVWDASTTRATPRAVIPLRMRLPGSPTMIAYGRPRRLTPSTQRQRDNGIVDLTATFQTFDSCFYADGPDGAGRSVTLTLITAAGTGITWPVTWPITWGAQGVRQDAVVNAGNKPSWPVITIRGPVAQPSIELVGSGRRLRLDTTLAADRSITIDTRPWAQTILRDDGASFAGLAFGAGLADFRLPVGQTVLAYRGTDLSGQSTCTIAWRDAYETP